MSVLTDSYDARVASGALQDDPAQRGVLHALEALRVRLEAPPARRLRRLFRDRDPAPGGLYIWGDVGRGKSMLMDLFIQNLNVAGKRRVHFHAFMQEVQEALTRARATETADPLVPVAAALAKGLRVLALDEMQITDIADAMIVGRLFERLLGAGVAVVTTSNRPPDDLYKHGLNRKIFLPFIELIKTRLEVLELASEEDYRRQVLAGNPSYFVPADGLAVARIDAIWDQLTGGKDEVFEIRRKGRVIPLARFHAGMARIGFEALCGEPLGPGDYLAIAEAVRLLVIEDIPLLSPANFDRAKRFVTLVDALYEARVRLIASAAARPEELYPEGTGSFEFHRTASRLIEMQGADWGQGDP